MIRERRAGSAVNQIALRPPVDRYNSARSGFIHSLADEYIRKSGFASLDALDAQAAADGLTVIQCNPTSLHAAFDLQTASDSLVVLRINATSFYVCLDSHLSNLLCCILGKVAELSAFTLICGIK